MKNNQMRKPNKKGSAYFDGFIRMKGSDFLAMERPENLIRKVPMLVKDIAYGNIELPKYGRYFTPNFVYMVSQEVDRIYYTKLAHYRAMEVYSPKFPTNEFLKRVLREDGEETAAWSIVHEGFKNILLSNGNLSYLNIMATQLKQYRFRL